MKISLDQKILGGFIFSTLILIVVAVISFRNSEKFLETNHLVNHTREVLYEFEQILVTTVNAETGARGFVITGNDDFLEPYRNAKAEINQHMNKARQLTSENVQHRRHLEEIDKLITERFFFLEETIRLRKDEGFTAAQELVTNATGKRLQDQIRGYIDKSKTIEQQLLSERTRKSEDDSNAFNLLFFFLLLTVSAVLIIVYIIVMTNLRALRKAEFETANRNWTLNGSSDLTKEMQGNKSQSELAQIITRCLSVHLDAQMAAMYVADEGSSGLRYIGGYAADSPSSVDPTSKTGQGLVGQAVSQKRLIVIKDIPEDHFNVSGAFGKLKPKTLLVFPFLFEGNVVGVLELGTVHSFSDLKLDYLNLIADSISIAITSAQAREQAQELLEETQRQSEELQAQQEELKQANEELHAKTEMLETSEAELITQQEELKRTNEELEDKATMLSDQKEKLEFAKSEIENKAREVEVTSRYKSEFLANMSHELRTPLNSILLLSQLLSENKNKNLSIREVEFSRNIHSSGTDLLNLINEILDLSKVEAGKLHLDIEDVTFADLKSELVAMFSELANNRSIDFEVKINETSLPRTIATDRLRIQQVLRNLLSNAFKFTGAGGKVILSIDKAAEPNGDDNVSFAVQDTGIGIPHDKLDIIFEAFQQVDGSTKRKYGGTGLGLSISRELASALGGHLYVESEEKKGSTFTLILPVRFTGEGLQAPNQRVVVKREVATKEEQVKSDLAVQSFYKDIDDRNSIHENDRIVLVIAEEDNIANPILKTARAEGYKAILARQGNTGLSFARHYRPAAIYLDMAIPVLHGGEVLRQLKATPDIRHIPVVVLSDRDARKGMLELGAFDFILKPLNIPVVEVTLDRIQNFIETSVKKLLIVEDDETQSKAIKELIGNGDVRSYMAHTGSDAYDMLAREAFDCIILDLALPDISGFELLEKIRSDANLNRIPVIVYTGKDLQREDRIKLSKLADTVVLKTVDSHERLLDEVMLFLHRAETRLPKEKQSIIRKLHDENEVLKNRTVLLVDDDIRNVYSVSNALEDQDVKCITAENGQVAIDLLKNNGKIDLVLMDVMMPVMDGYEATMEIRKLPQFAKLPVIGLTAKAMKGDREKCLAVGMSDYISKPVNMQELLAVMRTWLFA